MDVHTDLVAAYLRILVEVSLIANIRDAIALSRHDVSTYTALSFSVQLSLSLSRPSLI